MKSNEYPFFHKTKFKLTMGFSLAIFFYLFLIFFLPFGIDNYNPNHKYTAEFLVEIGKFAMLVLIFALANEFLLKPIFLKESSKKQVILWSIWTLWLLDTLVFHTYNYLGNWHDYSFKSYLGFLVDCSSVFIFPIIGCLFYFRYQILEDKIEHILTSKSKSDHSDQLIVFKGDGAKDEITLAASKFLYGKAQDNYVELYYLENDEIKKFLMRSSLNKLLDRINFGSIHRCHRSYLVNLLHVKAIKGSTQDANLFLSPHDTAIPVSKTFHKDIMDRLHEIKIFA